VIRRKKSLRPRKAIPAKNGKRRAKAFARAYHSKERVAFIQSLPCHACGVRPSDNAHIPDPSSGMGLKAVYTAICPLCRSCHVILHAIGPSRFQIRYSVSLVAGANLAAAAWLAFSGEAPEC
jgi:hypothetical protein